MRRLACCCVLLPVLASPSGADGRQLDFRDLGVYGTLYDFCTFTVYKLQATDDAAQLQRYRQLVHDAHEAGKFTLVGLYTFDRVTYKEPLEVYIRQTDQVLDALDLREVDALFLSEENVTWNNGLAILNGLYDHVKSRYPGPVYQWYTMPDVPDAKQKADGWIIDPYGFRSTEYRRYLMKYLVGGKPVIACLNASEDVAAWESSQDQAMVCAEFNVPMFFYGVDRELGAPNVWRGADEPELATWRGWVYRVREFQQSSAIASAARPLASTSFSPGRPVEVAGDLNGDVTYAETFDTVRFMDDASVQGFLGLRWSGEEETLSVLPTASEPSVLTYHLFSLLPLSSVAITTDPETPIELSTDGLTFGVGPRSASDWQGRNVWVRLPVGPGSTLREWSLKGRIVPPTQRAIALQPVRGRCHYEDGFSAPRYLQLAEVDHPDRLIPARGSVGIRGMEGIANRVEIRQRFVCEKPLEGLRVELTSGAWERDLNAHNELSVSLDGANPLASETTRGKAAGGRYEGTLTVDLTSDPRTQGTRQFWVHMVMANGSGVHTNVSNTLQRLQVWASVPAGG